MDINSTALLIIAFFTAVAALSGSWLVGLAFLLAMACGYEGF